MSALIWTATVSVCAVTFADEQTADWDGTSGNWSDVTHWSTNPVYPNNGGGTTYAVGISAGSVTVDVPVTIDSMVFSGGTLSNPNTNLKFVDGGNLLVTGGSYPLGTITNFNADVRLPGDFSPKIASAGSLTLGGGDVNVTLGEVAVTGSLIKLGSGTMQTTAYPFISFDPASRTTIAGGVFTVTARENLFTHLAGTFTVAAGAEMDVAFYPLVSISDVGPTTFAGAGVTRLLSGQYRQTGTATTVVSGNLHWDGVSLATGTVAVMDGGTLTWSTGTATNMSVTVASGGTMVIDGAVHGSFPMVTVNSGGAIRFHARPNPLSVVNRGTAVFGDNDQSATWIGFGLSNLGTILKTGAGTMKLYDVGGTVHTQSGTLTLSADQTGTGSVFPVYGGTITTDPGAITNFITGSAGLGSITFAGAGTTNLNSANLTAVANTTATISGTVQMQSGSFSAAALTIGNGGNFNWSGGSFNYSSPISIASGGALTLSVGSLSGTSAIVNFGSLIKTGTGAATLASNVFASGVATSVLSVQSGTLSINAPSSFFVSGDSFAGTIAVAPGAVLDFAVGTSTVRTALFVGSVFTIPTSFTGGGTVRVSGGTLNSSMAAITTPIDVAGGRLLLSASAVSAGGSITVDSGTMTFSQTASPTTIGSGASVAWNGGDIRSAGSSAGAVTFLAGSVFSLNGQSLVSSTPANLIVNNLGSATCGAAGVDQTINPGQFNNSGAFTKAGSGSTTFTGSMNNAGAINVQAGLLVFTSSLGGAGSVNVATGAALTAASISQNSLTIDGSAAIAQGYGPIVVNALVIGAAGSLDLADNDLIVNYASSSPEEAIRGYLARAFDNGSWDGTGIESSAAHADITSRTALGYANASDLGLTIFDGQSVSSAVLVKYTYYGDSNVDGKVDAADFQSFLDGLVTGGGTWVQGDYTYDGKVDLGNDFNLFLTGFMLQGGVLGDLEPIIANDSELSATQRAQLIQAVPEPSVASLFGIATIAMGCGSRRSFRRYRQVSGSA